MQETIPEKTEWTTVSVPKSLMDRVEQVWRKVGCVSPAEYARRALMERLERDEEE